MMQGHPVASAHHHHQVGFYDADSELVSVLAGYVADGLAAGERVVVIATAAHRHALDEALALQGTDPRRLRASRQYLTFDAQRTLDAFMVEGLPDRGRFVSQVAPLVAVDPAGVQRVRAFGEMVALLWDGGNVTGALALESLWNDLAQHHAFLLLCAYSTTVLDASALADVDEICGLHSSVRPPVSYAAGNGAAPAGEGFQRSSVFVPAPDAIGAARRFVTGALRSWGEQRLLWEAALVTSELATNAVRHGHSPFRASVGRTDGVVRIGIEDARSGLPQLRRAELEDTGGRGVAIVEHLSDRWGCDELAEGKVTWAELTSTSGDRKTPAP